MRHLWTLWLAAGLVAVPAAARAQENVSAGGRVETDLWQNPESPPPALLDGDITTHFCQHRLEDSDFRVYLAGPARNQPGQFILIFDYEFDPLVRPFNRRPVFCTPLPSPPPLRYPGVGA